jgi:hypothetical protein
MSRTTYLASGSFIISGLSVALNSMTWTSTHHHWIAEFHVVAGVLIAAFGAWLLGSKWADKDEQGGGERDREQLDRSARKVGIYVAAFLVPCSIGVFFLYMGITAKMMSVPLGKERLDSFIERNLPEGWGLVWQAGDVPIVDFAALNEIGGLDFETGGGVVTQSDRINEAWRFFDFVLARGESAQMIPYVYVCFNWQQKTAFVESGVAPTGNDGDWCRVNFKP